MFKRIAALLISLLMVLSLSLVVFADFGDFGGDSDYGGGGGYDDYGGGSYDDDDDDYGGSYYERETTTTTYYSYKSYPSGNIYLGEYILLNADGEVIEQSVPVETGDEDDSGTNAVFGAIILGAGLIVAACVIKRNDPSSSYVPRGKTPVNTGVTAEKKENLNVMNGYLKLDPEFSETELKEKISNMYVKLQNAWQDKNLEEVRPYLTDTLYGQYDRQLDAYRRNKQTNYIERIAVLSVDLTGWRQSGDNDIIVAEVRTRIVDYVVSDVDNSLVRGSKTAEKFMTYEWTLSRKSGVKTSNKEGLHTVNCPNCGAPVDINKSAKCEYCGSIITTESTDWTINGIKGLAQRTAGK